MFCSAFAYFASFLLFISSACVFLLKFCLYVFLLCSPLDGVVRELTECRFFRKAVDAAVPPTSRTLRVRMSRKSDKPRWFNVEQRCLPTSLAYVTDSSLLAFPIPRSRSARRVERARSPAAAHATHAITPQHPSTKNLLLSFIVTWLFASVLSVIVFIVAAISVVIAIFA